jgi:hypothetical protein
MISAQTHFAFVAEIRHLARPPQAARRVAGHHIALHAHPAYVNTLFDLLRVIGGVALGDAGALFGGILHLLRTGRQTGGERYQATQALQSHGTLS